MQFCSIDEAWGSNNCQYYKNESSPNDTIKNEIKEQPKQHGKKVTFHKDTEVNVSSDSEADTIYENFTDTINKKDMKKIINKVMKSKKCRRILKNKFRPPIYEKLNLILEDYKDIIILVLIGFSILIFFKMLTSI